MIVGVSINKDLSENFLLTFQGVNKSVFALHKKRQPMVSYVSPVSMHKVAVTRINQGS